MKFNIMKVGYKCKFPAELDTLVYKVPLQNLLQPLSFRNVGQPLLEITPLSTQNLHSAGVGGVPKIVFKAQVKLRFTSAFNKWKFLSIFLSFYLGHSKSGSK